MSEAESYGRESSVIPAKSPYRFFYGLLSAVPSSEQELHRLYESGRRRVERREHQEVARERQARSRT